MELQLPIPIAMKLRREPAGRHPLRSARHEKNLNRKLNAVRQREPNVRHVGLTHDGSLTKLAHAARLLRAQQMAHAGMPADKFSRRGLFEALGRSAVRLQLHFLILLHNPLVPASSYAFKWHRHSCLCAFTLGSIQNTWHSSELARKRCPTPARPQKPNGSAQAQHPRLSSVQATPAKYSLPCAARIPPARGR